MRFQHRREFLSARYKRRHPNEKWPQWLRELQDEIAYWLTSTAHKRHKQPFAKTKRGLMRRVERLNKQIERNRELTQ